MMAVRTALLAVLAIAGVARVCNAQSTSLPLVTDLAGAGWTVQNTNGSIKLDTSIPGYALEALVNAGQAPNPLARYGRSNCSDLPLTASMYPVLKPVLHVDFISNMHQWGNYGEECVPEACLVH